MLRPPGDAGGASASWGWGLEAVRKGMAVVDEPHARHLRLIVVPMGRCPNGDSSKPHLTHLELANSAIPFRMASQGGPAQGRVPSRSARQTLQEVVPRGLGLKRP